MSYSSAAIIQNGPLLLGVTAVPIVAMAYRNLKEEKTEEEKKEFEKEKERRAQRVAENVEILKAIEQMEEEAKFAKGSPLASIDEDNSKLSAIAPSAKEEEEEAEEGENGEDEEDDGVGTITAETHGEKVSNLCEIDPNAPELEEGLAWVGKLTLKELQIAIKKTREQKSHEYADGSKLQRMLDRNEYKLDNFDRTSKYKIPPDIRVAIREEARGGWKVRRVQQWNGFFKGLKIIMQARECVPWVASSMVVSAAKSYISTSAQIYQANVMDALIKGDIFMMKQNALATAIVEVLSSMIGVLSQQLSNASRSKVTESLSIRVCKSILSKDMAFWKECKDPWGMVDKLFRLEYQVREALEAPQSLITQAVSIVTMLRELFRKSGNMYFLLGGLQLLQIGIRRLIDYMNEHFDRYVSAQIVEPTEDQYSFFYALKPEFAQMFQAFSRTNMELKSFKRWVKSSSRRDELEGVVSAVMDPLNTVTSQTTRMIEYSTMKGLMDKGEIDFNEASNLLSYASQASSNLQSGYRQCAALAAKMDPLAAAYDLINIRSKIDLEAGFIPKGKAVGHFVFDKVEFRYPGKIGSSMLLKGVSFEAKPGQVIGITGETGCGKSTCLRLVQRFYDVSGGRIMLDGKDIREYNPEWLRSQIAIVEQEPKLLPMTIRENLIFGCENEPTREEIQKACESAQIWESLNDKEKFPEFLETKMYMIPNVAGGEKQRLCIARAILMNPSVLLLDEATSALDEVNQHKVQEALNELMKGRTTFIIAHRLSTIKDSDKLIGLANGIVVDDGTHSELLAKKDDEPNVWKTLWKEQGFDKSSVAPPPPPVPKLQRSTSSIGGKFAVLRSALQASLPKEKAESILELVNELESGGTSDEHFKHTVEAAGLHLTSKWGTVRGALKTHKLVSEDGHTLQRSTSVPSPSVATESTDRLTRTISSSGKPVVARELSFRSANASHVVRAGSTTWT